MQAKSVFLNIQGNTARNRILSFLVVHSEYDYSMRDIARFAKVGYTTLKILWKGLISSGMIIHTRTVGRAKMYKLNMKSPVAEKYVEFYWAVVESVVTQSADNKEELAVRRKTVVASVETV